MKHLTAVTAFAAALLVSLPALASDYKRITKQADFNRIVVGQKITAERGWIMINPDGTISGDNSVHGPVTGAWNWKGKHWCRQVKAGDRDYGNDCQVIMVDGDKIVFIRDRGQGEQVHMKIE